jgi:hypothetical protein
LIFTNRSTLPYDPLRRAEGTPRGRECYRRVQYLTGVHLTGVHLTGVHLMGVHLIGVRLMGVYLMGVYLMGVRLMGMCFMAVHLTGVHLMGMHFMGMYLIGVYLTGMCLMGMYNTLWASSYGRVPHRRAFYGRVPHKSSPCSVHVPTACTPHPTHHQMHTPSFEHSDLNNYIIK